MAGVGPARSALWNSAMQGLEAIAASPERLNDIYARLNRLNPSPTTLTMVSAKKRKNASCNRYLNVLPYDHNCVKVCAEAENGARGKYVNASRLKSSPEDIVQWEFIATQGPLPSTVADFWHMVVENRCSAIVMLTPIQEGRTSKCCQYFPAAADGTLEFDGGRVVCSSVVPSAGGAIHVRELIVHIAGKTVDAGYSCVHHLFQKWPDHGAPQESRSIQQLLHDVDQVTSNGNGIACVHCSAGIGRTGTYIAIDIILRRLRLLANECCSEEELAWALDVAELVQELRHQRMGLVQTVDQLRYIYTTVYECAKDMSLLK